MGLEGQALAETEYAADIVYRETEVTLFEVVAPLRDVGVITVLAWFLIRLAVRVEKNIVTPRGRSGR